MSDSVIEKLHILNRYVIENINSIYSETMTLLIDEIEQDYNKIITDLKESNKQKWAILNRNSLRNGGY